MEKIKKEKIVKVIIGIITIILILLMFYFIDFRLILSNFSKISIYGIILFVLIYTITFILRAYRLKFILQGLNSDASFLNLFGSFGIGWGINEIIPGKFGDLVRLEFIRQKERNLNRSKILCGISIERFIDLAILLLITIFTLLYLYFYDVKGINKLNLSFYIGIGALILIFSLIAVLILFFKGSWFLKIVGKISKKLMKKLEIFLKEFLIGINDFRKNKKKIVITVVLSLPIWIIETLTLVLIFYLIGYEINIFIIILAQSVLFFTKTFPITPGGWFISENVGALIILVFYPSIPYNILLSIFILDHILRVAYSLIYGSISTTTVNLKKIKLKKLNGDIE